jgi:hypothetical protein
LYEAAKETYHVYHINIKETASGHRSEVNDGWERFMDKDHFIPLDHKEDVAKTIADKITYVHIEEDDGPVRIIRAA